MAKPEDARTALDSERAIPAEDSYQSAWHKSRYAFASQFAIDRDVLDAGSGEGYGAAFLAGIARSVVAVDYAPIAVAHARARYVRPNLSFHEGDLERLEGFRGPFDVITALEVIEHVANHDAFFSAMRSRLCPDGVLIVSTPNALYHGYPGDNPYHVSEVQPSVLRAEAKRAFRHVRLFGQLGRDARLRATAKLIVDPFFLRRRLQRACGRYGADGGHEEHPGNTISPPRSFTFSRPLCRVSPVTVLVARP
jgi:SAM-dependent methyltransferase